MITRGPYTLQALRAVKHGYIPVGPPREIATHPAMMRGARDLYDLTGVVPDVRDASGRDALHHTDVALWGLQT